MRHEAINQNIAHFTRHQSSFCWGLYQKVGTSLKIEIARLPFNKLAWRRINHEDNCFPENQSAVWVTDVWQLPFQEWRQIVGTTSHKLFLSSFTATIKSLTHMYFHRKCGYPPTYSDRQHYTNIWLHLYACLWHLNAPVLGGLFDHIRLDRLMY